MTVLVTGASGFLGCHVVRRLLARGQSVRAMVRPTSRLDNLRGLEVETVRGDLTDPGSLRAALRGVKILYHVAADYRLSSPEPKVLYEANVGGTDNILKAAAEAGVERIVYTSSVSAIGIPADGTPGNENSPVTLEDMIGDYKRSKFQAQEVALRHAAAGLPVVIVNPSTPVGTLDIKPTQTGQMIVDFLNGKMPAYVETGLNIVDAEDVAEGHVLAAEKGVVGEKYILGNRDMSFKQILDVLSGISGVPSPRFRMPWGLAYAIGVVDEMVSRNVLHKAPRVPLEGVKMARKRMFFDPSKAVHGLGLPQTAPEIALEKAVRWFVDNGYAKLAVRA
ncbi:MAG: NAD-dependent epimerase/dehydratase family protein [Armatimonadetes bacterium]|nr:NAD-dependent epimerase/dehydratase family protein [Armatimonadota bacterium]